MTLPPGVGDRYDAAVALCIPTAPSFAILIRHNLDAEAFELIWRTRLGPNQLTTKIQILFYLLEVRADYAFYFLGQSEPLPLALAALIQAVFSTAWKFVKGEYLVREYRLYV